MNLIRLFDSVRAASRVSTALANGHRVDPFDIEQLGLTEVMKRNTAAPDDQSGVNRR